MIKFTPFKAGHLSYLKPQPEQKIEHRILASEGASVMLNQHFGLSAWVDLKCVGCAGLVPIFPHRAIAWIILSSEAQPYMLSIVRKVKKIIKQSEYARIELTVAVDFKQAEKFARLIGAKCETPDALKKFGALGGDEKMYSIVKGE